MVSFQKLCWKFGSNLLTIVPFLWFTCLNLFELLHFVLKSLSLLNKRLQVFSDVYLGYYTVKGLSIGYSYKCPIMFQFHEFVYLLLVYYYNYNCKVIFPKANLISINKRKVKAGNWNKSITRNHEPHGLIRLNNAPGQPPNKHLLHQTLYFVASTKCFPANLVIYFK